MSTHALAVKIGSLKLRDPASGVKLSRVEYAEALDDLDAMTAVFSTDQESVAATWKKVQPGTEYTLDFIKEADKSVISSVKGVVVEVDIEKIGADRYRFHVIGLELLCKLRGSGAEVAWEDAPDKIAKAIASAGGMTPAADGSNVVKYRVDQGELDDVVFLKLLAARFAYRVGVVDGKLEFKRRTVVSSTVPIAQDEMFDARIRISVDGLVTEATIWGRDPKENGWFSEKVTDIGAGISGTVKGMDLAKKVYKKAALEMKDAGCTTPGAAQERAKAELRLRAERFVTGSVLVAGNPKLRTGIDVELKDEAWPFKGKYRVGQVRHVEDGELGYRTTVEFYSDSLPTPA